MAILALSVFAVSTLLSDAYIHLRHPRAPHFIMGRPPGGFLEAGYRSALGENENVKASYPNVEEFTIIQPLDHFNKSDTRTWEQRVQYNPMFYNNQSVVFVMIGGESMISQKWVGNENVSMMQWAKEFGAAAFQLEHRFFGYSRPFPTMTTEALVYCTTEQALADLAEFIQQMNAKYSFVNPRWVTFGGSYPGSLSAWFRSKYPQLTVGAVASSAPLNLKLDFYEYSMVVENVLRETDPECHWRVENAIAYIEKIMLTSTGRQQLNQVFNLQPPFDEASVTPLTLHNFMSNLYTMFQGIVQYTYDGRNEHTMGGMNVRNLCNTVTKAPADEPLQQMRAVMDFVNSFYPQTGNCIGNVSACTFANSYEDIISLYGNVTYDESTDNAAYRGWMWLCCNEIGFLQTTDQGKNIFGEMLPLNFYIDMCTDLFGPSVNIETIAKGNAAAQKYYGRAEHYKATNVILPNGSLDPWHALGTYTEDKTTHQIPLLINGTAHCADMYPAYPDEPASLPAAREKIKEELAYYIQQTPSPSSRL